MWKNLSPTKLKFFLLHLVINFCIGQTCNNGGDCFSNLTSSTYQCVCYSGYNGVNCANQYFKCLSPGTYADPLYCYKYIICTSVNGVMTSKTTLTTTCSKIGSFQTLFDPVKKICVMPSQYSTTSTCSRV